MMVSYSQYFQQRLIGLACNWLYDLLIDIALWVDINVINVDEFPLWVEVDELEKRK